MEIGRRVVALAWIFTDHISTELHRGSSFQKFVYSPCMGESLAILEVLLHTVPLNLLHICTQTDFQVLVIAISSRRRLTELYGILTNIDDLSLFYICMSFVLFWFHSRLM